jgi:Mrp family chromosome partitioning ATPase/capsular polysaccharide biosynthesis protein
LRDYLRVLRRHGALIIGAVVLVGGSALIFSLLKSPSYVASATVSFTDQSNDLAAAGIPVPQNPNPDKFAAAEAKFVQDPQVVAGVQRTLKLRESTGDLRSAVTTQVDPSSNLVDISASASSARLSARLANGFARQTQIVLTRRQRDQYRLAADGLQAKIRALPPNSTLRGPYLDGVGRLVTLSTVARPVAIQQPAEVPAGPASPKPVLYTIVGAFLGLLVGCAAAFLRESLDRRLTDPAEVERQLGFTLLGYVPATALGQIGAGENGAGPAVEDFEAFRILRFNSKFLEPEQVQKTILITSPLAEEGKSTVAAGLAAANTLAGQQTLLVEGDLRRPILAERLGILQAPGLTDYLEGAAKPEELVQLVDVLDLGWPQLKSTTLSEDQTTRRASSSSDVKPTSLTPVRPDARLACITAGRATSRPAELLGSARFADLLKMVRETYDLVVIDSAPLLPVGDTLELLTSVDGILVCIRVEQTTRDQALAAKAALDRLPGRPTGLVITGIKPKPSEGYYGYEYAAAAASPAK